MELSDDRNARDRTQSAEARVARQDGRRGWSIGRSNPIRRTASASIVRRQSSSNNGRRTHYDFAAWGFSAAGVTNFRLSSEPQKRRRMIRNGDDRTQSAGRRLKASDDPKRRRSNPIHRRSKGDKGRSRRTGKSRRSNPIRRMLARGEVRASHGDPARPRSAARVLGFDLCDGLRHHHAVGDGVAVGTEEGDVEWFFVIPVVALQSLAATTPRTTLGTIDQAERLAEGGRVPRRTGPDAAGSKGVESKFPDDGRVGRTRLADACVGFFSSFATREMVSVATSDRTPLRTGRQAEQTILAGLDESTRNDPGDGSFSTLSIIEQNEYRSHAISTRITIVSFVRIFMHRRSPQKQRRLAADAEARYVGCTDGRPTRPTARCWTVFERRRITFDASSDRLRFGLLLEVLGHVFGFHRILPIATVAAMRRRRSIVAPS